MFLVRDAFELKCHDVHYWVNHFLSCDDWEKEDFMKTRVRHCQTWPEALAIVEQLPWCVHPELCVEGDVPWRINNFFSSGDYEAADVMLDAAWAAHDNNLPWEEIVAIVEASEKTWRRQLECNCEFQNNLVH